jgi:hypothetical protein
MTSRFQTRAVFNFRAVLSGAVFSSGGVSRFGTLFGCRQHSVEAGVNYSLRPKAVDK